MNKTNKIKVIVITGPTATGKTSLAVKIGRSYNGEIISADSRQVYRGLDIGTGKDIEEYGTGDNAVKYHLIDIASPRKEYNLRQFNLDAINLINNIENNNKLPIIAGGSVLYIDSLISNYDFPRLPPDEEIRERFKNKSTSDLIEFLEANYPDIIKRQTSDLTRPRLTRLIEAVLSKRNRRHSDASNFEWLIVGTFFQRSMVHKRIELRLDERLSNGMIEEIELLHKQGVSWERLDSFGLEYRYVSKMLKNEVSFAEMRLTLLAKIRKLARSQDVWFRKLEKKGHKIHWIPKGDFNKASLLISDFLKNKPIPEPTTRLMDIYYGPKS